MLALLGGLLFRTRLFVEQIVEKPNEEQASRLGFFLLVLLMVNTAFQLGFDSTLHQDLIKVGLNDIAIWVIVFFIPPIQYYLQRFLFVISARLGLAMFAGKQMPSDPYEKKDKLHRLKLLFPYVMYPSVFFSFLASPVANTVVGFLLAVIGLVYMFLISVYALHKLYGVSPTVAFWGPLVVHVLIFIALVIVVALIFAVLILAGVIPVADLS